MSPRAFLGLAVAAAISVAAAAIVYTSSTNWSSITPKGVALLPALRDGKPNVAAIEISEGDKKLTLENRGQDWVLKERDGYPAKSDKVRILLRSLADADLVEPKTRNKDRYALLGLEDPSDKDAKSKLVRLIDDKGNTIAGVIVGNSRADAFGTGKDGSYVRKPDDPQTWLVNTEIDAGAEVVDWVGTSLFGAGQDQVKHLDVTVPGEEVMHIQPSTDSKHFILANMPDGMKLKYDNALDDIVEAATDISFDDVKKSPTPPGGDQVGTAVLELNNGLKVSFTIQPDQDGAWVTAEASGDGDAKKIADQLNANAKGWAFRIPLSKANAILQRRETFLEKVSS